MTSDQIRRDLHTALVSVFQPYFTIVAEDASPRLTLEVTVDHWGWAVPVDPHGLRTEGYDFMFRGTSRINDRTAGGATIANFYNGTKTPIAIPVVEESCKRAYPPAIAAFAENVGKYLLKNRPTLSGE